MSTRPVLHRSCLENRIAASKSYITSYADWTTAYEHLHTKVDTDWAYTQQNIGKTLFTSDGYDGVFVLDRQRTKYAVVQGLQDEGRFRACSTFLWRR